MKIYNSQTLHEIDKATCEAQSIDSIELMERAANAISCEIVSRFPMKQRFVVIAGPGNNGGDALATARMLIEQGYRNVEVFLFNVYKKLSHDCEIERQRLITLDGIDFTEVTREFTPPYLSKTDVVIDGLFGSGLRQPMQGGFKSVAQYVNESGAFVISIDMPSGLFCEWNDNVNRREVMHADLTLAIHSPRLSFMFEENAGVIGEWKVLDIDLVVPKEKEKDFDYSLMEEKNIRAQLHPREPFTGKRDYGSVLIFAGSMGMMGAAVMCAQAALRSGAGLATVHSAKCGMTILQTAVPEAMFEPDKSEFYISDMSVHHNHQVVAAGPGIGTDQHTIDALESLVKLAESPLVLDADALNCIVERPAILGLLKPNTVITPHIGEFDRLFGEHNSSDERLRKAIDMAKYYGITIVLKGHYTAVIRPSGRVYFNPTGNPGMATAGAGDVLTGLIAAFIAQGYRPDLAATLGVYIHGLAGDMARDALGETGMTATDISAYVGRAIHSIISNRKNTSK